MNLLYNKSFICKGNYNETHAFLVLLLYQFILFVLSYLILSYSIPNMENHF